MLLAVNKLLNVSRQMVEEDQGVVLNQAVSCYNGQRSREPSNLGMLDPDGQQSS